MNLVSRLMSEFLYATANGFSLDVKRYLINETIAGAAPCGVRKRNRLHFTLLSPPVRNRIVVLLLRVRSFQGPNRYIGPP